MTDTVRVPREPTEAMLEAANSAAMAFAGGDLAEAVSAIKFNRSWRHVSREQETDQ